MRRSPRVRRRRSTRLYGFRLRLTWYPIPLSRYPTATKPWPDAMYEYHLFAVINHEGHIENGRYTNFARFQDNSLRYNDPFNLLHTI
ncbi:hypothetical protein EDD16DRAFT_1552198 [Pisolithus croceorrhizus]|nr:hypothetical protein EDD16DRAFT_1552198 [Pisolithus croceorrhizus]